MVGCARRCFVGEAPTRVTPTRPLAGSVLIVPWHGDGQLNGALAATDSTESYKYGSYVETSMSTPEIVTHGDTSYVSLERVNLGLKILTDSKAGSSRVR